MKKYLKSLLMLAAMASMVACSLDKLPEDKTEEVDGLGYLQMGDVVVTGDIENQGDNGEMESESGLRRTRAEEVNNLTQAADDYYVEIVNSANNEVKWSGSYADAKSTTKYSETPGKIGLEPGHYVVYAYQTEAKEPAAGVTNAPYFTGKSEEIEIKTSSKQHEVPTAQVVCTMANVKVSVEHSADMKMLFRSKGDNSIAMNPAEGKELETTITMSAANIDNTASQLFGWDSTHEDEDVVYFTDIAGASSADGNTLTLFLEGVYYTGNPTDIYDADYKQQDIAGGANNANWKEVEMTHTISGVKAAQWRKISIDIDNSTSGNVKFIFTIESYTYDEEIEVRMMEVFADLDMEESMPDDEISDPLAPTIKIKGNADNNYNYAIDASKIDIYSSTASDIAWNSRFNATITPQEGTTVEKVYAVLKYTSDEKLREAMEKKGYANSRVDLCPDNKAATYANLLQSGSGKVLALTNAGMSAFYKYPGEHTIRLYSEDSEQRVGYVDIILTVSQSAISGGDGPTVVWMKDDVDVIDQTHQLTSAKPYETTINITTDKGIKSILVNINAELLTPEELASFGLAAEMDLVNPATAEMESGLRSLGFIPMLGDDAYGDDDYRIWYPNPNPKTDPDVPKEGAVSPLYMQNEVNFSITNFTGLLWGLYNGSKASVENFVATFTITAIDADGGKTVKDVKFEMVCE